MTLAEVLVELETMGTAQNRKVYARHGVSGEMFGVSYANLGKLRKQIKVDHQLALGLWESGYHDARVLATMVADPEQVSGPLLEDWARDLDNYVLTDALSSVAARSRQAMRKMQKWTRSRNEWVAAAGWNLLAQLALSDREQDHDFYAGYLELVEQRIHTSKNRVRHSMNSALISIGLRSPALERKALAAAKRIGKLEVDHGETGCKTPDAVVYIQRAKQRRKKP
jgi:3-methyladenine DNA glycosylase AlkD